MSEKGWIGVDLDRTLAESYGKSIDFHEIGEPIAPMVKLVKYWIGKGEDVRVFTSRAYYGDKATKPVQDWTEKHIGVRLPVTNIKDPFMKVLYDDRAVSVEPNTGKILTK